jgi:hypothetical protein
MLHIPAGIPRYSQVICHVSYTIIFYHTKHLKLYIHNTYIYIYIHKASFGPELPSCLHCDQRSVDQSVLTSGSHLRPMTRFVLLPDICGLHILGRPTRREDGSLIYSYNSMSVSGPRPAELMTTSYCPVWDSTNLEGRVSVFISPPPKVTGWPIYILSLLTTLRATVEIFRLASKKHCFHYFLCYHGDVLCVNFLATGVYITLFSIWDICYF